MEKSLFGQICSIENLFAAWERFSEGKHSKIDVMAYEFQLEDSLFALHDSLLSGEYRHHPYKPFTIFDPKQRQIHKATVKDRVVHQAIVNVIEPLFESQFIHDSYSCRIGKGTHAAVDRLRSFFRQASHNNTRTVYALKCDVRKYFASVDHSVLLSLLRRRIRDERTLGLIEKIVSSFSLSEGRGIPLGNLTSQLFANVYLHELDLYVKHDLRVCHYLRYCDDFVILTPLRSGAFDLAERIGVFLKSRLNIELHPNKVMVRTWEQGADFLGYVLLPKAVVLRTKTAHRIVRRANQKNEMSYLGVCSHADAFGLGQVIKSRVGYEV